MTLDRWTARDERGTALIEFIWLGLLLLVPLVYILLAAFDVQRASYGASAASRAAGRAYVLAPDQASALARAETAARVALADQGVDVERSVLTVSCAPDPGRCLSPGSVITVSVTVQQPLPIAPAVFGSATPTVRVASTHVEPYGTFREDRS
jgi:Flp pilus assembly protein TadG